jgi:hypothetical protein
MYTSNGDGGKRIMVQARLAKQPEKLKKKGLGIWLK